MSLLIIKKFRMHITGIIGQYAIPSTSSIEPVSSLNGSGKVQFSNSSFLEYSSLSWASTSCAVFTKVTLFSIAQNALATSVSFFPATFNPRDRKKFSVLQFSCYLTFRNPFSTKNILNISQFYLFTIFLYIVSFN